MANSIILINDKNMHINDKNMLYFRLCYTMFQPKLDHTQIETDEMLLFHEF